MDNLDEIMERIHQSFEAHTAARDHALTQARAITRAAAHSIRATHRGERQLAESKLAEARQLAATVQEELSEHPSVYFAGYTQDALKEYAEASIVYSLVHDGDLPSPQELHLEENTYLKGLAEAVGELRRRIMDLLRHGHSPEVERLLAYMDDIYAALVTMDYPDAVTGGLRRLTDLCRGIVERTRGDVTISLRQERLEANLRKVEERLDAYPAKVNKNNE